MIKKFIAIAVAMTMFVSTGTVAFADYETGIDAMTYDGHYIPAYDGDPYEIIEDEPCFNEYELVKIPVEDYGPLDELGRATSCFAILNQSLMPDYSRVSSMSFKPTGWVNNKQNAKVIMNPGWLWNRSHLIGFQLTGVWGAGGEKKDLAKYNLITGTQYMNANGLNDKMGMDYFEKLVATYLKKSDINYVAYRVTPVYEGNDLVAKGVIMEAEAIDDAESGFNDFSIFCYNVQPGVAIDYATGDNKFVIGDEQFVTTILPKAPAYNFTGSALEPKPTVSYVGTELTEGKDYTLSYENNTEVGQGTVIATGIGDYIGQVETDFRIVESGGVDVDKEDSAEDEIITVAIDIARATVKLNQYEYTYTGNQIQPPVKVTLDGETLTNGVDYTVTYDDNTQLGQGSVTVNGIGKYNGHQSVDFTIIPRGTGISKLKRGRKAFTVTWNSQKSNTTGYQIRYSTDKSMKGAKIVSVKKNTTVKKTVRKLKKHKTYYVEVRTYKYEGGKYYYSHWSTQRKVRTKW